MLIFHALLYNKEKEKLVSAKIVLSYLIARIFILYPKSKEGIALSSKQMIEQYPLCIYLKFWRKSFHVLFSDKDIFIGTSF